MAAELPYRGMSLLVCALCYSTLMYLLGGRDLLSRAL